MWFERSTAMWFHSVTSADLLDTLTIDQLKDKDDIILSALNGKLLFSCRELSELFIYNQEGRHLSTITINDNDELMDVTWTPRGNILYIQH